MAIDQFKTQVLLLHSEQSTLDELGSRFDQRYTVHVATSGSQALGTLADTPIDVIISAQDLPGMSGLDALREARKRSPDTIGILLTGNDEDSDEAFVGDEEVFHIVRGSVSKDELLQLVDSATKKMRLMALAESANDTKALVEGSGQHVTMETDETGSPVSTSASGRMPALDPATLASVNPVDVLVLTRDDEFLQTVQASSRGLHTVHSAPALSTASDIMQQSKIGVVVIDSAMVRDKVEHLTQHLRQEVPRLVAIVAGRRDDGDMLMELLNRGVVYRFLMKPVTPGRARLAVEAAVKYHLEAPEAAFSRVTGSTETTAASQTSDATESQPEEAAPSAQKAKSAEQPAAETQAWNDSIVPGDDQARLDQTIKTTQRMVKLAAAKLESQAVSKGYFPKLIGIVAAAIIGIAGAWLFFSGGADEQPGEIESTAASASTLESTSSTVSGSFRPSVTESTVQESATPLLTDSSSPSTTESSGPTLGMVTDTSNADSATVIAEPAAPNIDVDALLEAPRAARDAGAIYEPAGENAIELYRAALIESDSAPIVLEEFESVISAALALAEAALLATRLDEAELALRRVEQADAENVRLPFLSAQLQQARLLETLGDARAAIRDNRLQDAAAFLEAANAFEAPDRSAIKSVATELKQAQGELRNDKLLARAEARLQAGDLLTPENDNARYYFRLVLTNEPNNQAATQGLNVIASQLILQARGSIDKGDLARAEMLLGEVKILDPNNSQLLATSKALDSRRREARAESAAASAQAESANTAEDGLAGDTLPDAVPAAAAAATVTGADNDSTAFNSAPVAVSALVRTRYVAPRYPRAAQRRRLTGFVDIEFTVSIDGTVKEVQVRGAEPIDTFENAAINAVEKWEFEPILENGSATEKRAAVRMLFALE